MADPGPRTSHVASSVISTHSDISDPTAGPSSPGPLQQLRLASLSPETASSGNKKRTKTVKSGNKNQTRKQIRARHASRDPGFAFGIDFPASTRQLSSNNGPQADPVKDSSQMATVFLSSAKAAKAKYHVVDAVHAKDPLSVLTSQNGVPVPITPAIRRRADFVKSTLAMKFTWLQRVAEPVNGELSTHPGMDAGYNPLQVLRNRVARKKLGLQSPPQPQTPLPCDAFSSHAPANSKPWKMLWGIDLQEFISDFAWRKVYWTELRNARGDLWYPEMHQSTGTTSSTPPLHKSKKLHDRLWREVDRERDNVKNGNGDRDRDKDTNHDQNLNSHYNYPYLELPRSSDSSRSPKSNWKERAKRLYGASSISAVDLRALGNFTHTSSKSVDDSEQMYQFKLGQSGDLYQVSDSELFNVDRDNLPPPQIVIGDHPHISSDAVDDHPATSDHAEHVSDVYFSSAHSKHQSVMHLERTSQFASSSDSVDAESAKKFDVNMKSLHDVAQKLRYLRALSVIDHNFLSTVYPQLLDSTSATLDVLLQGELRHVLCSINHVNSTLLPARENLYKGFIEEAKSITHLANDTCAVKIDNLLSATDRSYGELNTSLIMDLRKTNEKLDKLNRSLFTGVIANTAIIDDTTKLYELADHKFLYIALENMIVVFLRLVWIGVNIVKPIFVFIRFIWRLLTLMFT